MKLEERIGASAPRSMSVLLIGFQDQDNLGLRYLASTVQACGHAAAIMTYGSDTERILARVVQEQPDVIGFSLIFQYMAPDFAQVIAGLRAAGIDAHITMGGHYPSFEYGEILGQIPGLDSVVRFEGELTLVALLDALALGENWRALPGLAYRDAKGAISSSPLREPLSDLNLLPLPDRESIDYESHPMATASVLGSRGCPWDCSFCSIRPFYEAQGGALRRLRDPRAVVHEMRDLYRNRGVSLFLFQDDDFLATGKRGRSWGSAVADAIREANLAGSIAFKISCRSDEVRPEIIERLVAGGLTHVYMGVESGDEIGLGNMNKMLDPSAHLRAGAILRRYGLSFDFGFMLLDPYSSFDSIRANIRFLESFIGDGWSVAPFCRMLPYAGTPIRERLRAEGRLAGTEFAPDYKFLDPRLDLFYQWMLETFYERNFTNAGLCNILRGLHFEAHLKLDDARRQSRITDERRSYLQHLTAVCNQIACYTLRAAVDHIESHSLHELERKPAYLHGLTGNEKAQELRLMTEIGQYYDSVHPNHDPIPGPVPGSFGKSWTIDREASGVGVA